MQAPAKPPNATDWPLTAEPGVAAVAGAARLPWFAGELWRGDSRRDDNCSDGTMQEYQTGGDSRRRVRWNCRPSSQ